MLRSVLLCVLACIALASEAHPKLAVSHHNISACQDRISMNDIDELLQRYAYTMSPALINTTLAILGCANKLDSLCNSKLTLIDYSQPSNQKRLWVFDVKNKILLYHDYVSHGINSGISRPSFFSNNSKSKASSLGVFETENNYYGRDGLSLRLKGLEKHFNDNADSRAVVMHSAWYVNEDFIRKYGRAGRSWGCPAIPENDNQSVIDAIKDQSLLIIYYPSDEWLKTSNFLKCDSALFSKLTWFVTPPPEVSDIETRGEILYGDVNKVNHLDSDVPVLSMSASNYQRIFKTPPPLSRMLRKQIYQTEYITLNLAELRQLDTNHDNHINDKDGANISMLEFFLPEMIKKGGRYRTEFKSANLGKVIDVDLSQENPVITTDKSKVTFKSTNQFIRWIGL